MKEKERLIVIDCHSLIHRAYHALPPLTTPKGELVNAVYGFLLVFFKAIKEFQPDYVAATFDLPQPTFRHKKFKEYKAKRAPTPKELYQQIPRVKEVLKGFNVPIFEEAGFEADDIIGAIAFLAPKKQTVPEIETIIVSGDLDTLQLVNSHTKVYALKRGVKDVILYDKEKVKERYQGLTPYQLPDFKGLKGDPSDNIPGVIGIGDKTAIFLIKTFESLENLYKEIEEDSEKTKEIKSRLKDLLKKYKDQAFFSKMLGTIKCDMQIDFNFKKCRWENFNKEEAVRVLEELGFHSLIRRLPSSEEKDGKTLKLW